jgi:hypothetical protein
MMAEEGPRDSHRRGVRGIVYARGALAIRIIVAPEGVTVLLALHNPPHSWTDTMGPSLLGFTITLSVDSLLCYRIDQMA